MLIYFFYFFFFYSLPKSEYPTFILIELEWNKIIYNFP